MKISFHEYNNIYIFDIPEGDGTIVDEVDELIDQMIEVNNNKANKIALDMTKTSFLNSTGLGDLVNIKDNLMDNGIELILVNPTEKVESLINMVGLDEFFHIVPSEDEL